MILRVTVRSYSRVCRRRFVIKMMAEPPTRTIIKIPPASQVGSELATVTRISRTTESP